MKPDNSTHNASAPTQGQANNQQLTAPSENVQVKFDWHLLRHFMGFLKPYKREVTIGLLPIPFSVAFSILFPWMIMKVIDTQLVAVNIDGLKWWALGLSLVLLGNYLADAIYGYFLQKAAQGAILDMRRNMFDRVLHFPRRYFDKTPMGVTLTRLTSDLEAIHESLATGLLSMIRDLLITLALLIFLFTINWKLTLVVLLIAPPVYFVTQFLRKRLRDAYVQSRIVLSQGTGYLQECLNGMKTVQLYSAEEETLEKYQTYTEAFVKTQSKSNLYDSALFSIIDGITTISMGLIIWYGANEILAMSITVGVLVGFLHTLDKIFVPIRDFTSQVAAIQRAFAAFDHIDEIFEQPLEEDEEQKQSTGELNTELFRGFESLVFDQVRFRYNDDGPYVLNGVSFSLHKGEKIALVGSTGSGKSTIIRLLTKTYGNYQGSIRLNGVELSQIPRAALGRFFSLMQQEVFLFDKSIAFNISLGREHISDEDVIAAAKYVYANEFVDKLPETYQFQLKDNGGNISAGQTQLIAFARAIASGAEVVMLDEATSAVDSVTESLIQKAIDHVFEQKTVIAIAHRLSTIQHSDEILVLDQGKITERGNHLSLMEQGGVYANLVSGDDNLISV
jgi:ATP-binding cassette, subfamily B, multidrug efflux pump